MPKRGGKIYHALNHPVRREIVKLLGVQGVLGSSELKEYLNIGPGKLYYHLENLGSLIEQDEERKYRLSEEGKEAYQLLITGEALPVREGAQRPLPRFLNVVRSAFLPGWLFSRLYKNPARHVPEGVILLLFGGWLCHVSGLQPLILFFVDQSLALNWTIAQFLGGWLVIYGLAELICLGIFQRKGGNVSLFVGSALSLVPLILFVGFWFFNEQLGWGLDHVWEGWLIRSLLLFCQGWTFCLLAVSVSQAKRLSIDRASTVSFAVAYLSIAVYLLTRGI